MIRYAAVVLVTGLALMGSARAGEYNKKLSIGDPAPSWAGLPGVDGKQHSLADLKDKDVVVLVVTCNSCPVAVAYEDRLLAFARKHAGADGKVALVAVNVNQGEADRLPKMKERAREQGFLFPYLYDETQQLGRAYGARYTPEFFVLDRERKVVYMGAMDDSSEPGQAKVNYLDLAVQAVLKGQKPTKAETLARGCSVKYAKARR